jgi:carboxyl-terminal processing protease
MKPKIIAYTFITLAVIFLYAFFLELKLNEKNKIHETCRFVYDRIYIDSKSLTSWLQDCKNRSSENTFSQNKKLQLSKELELTNDILDSLKVSHLKIYDQEKSSQIWNDWGRENGIIAKYVSAQLVVTEVIARSEAQVKGVRVGDIALEYEGEEAFPKHLTDGKGKFKFKRKGQIYQVNLEPKVLEYDANIKVLPVSSGISILKIPSFKGQYFAKEELFALAKKLEKSKKIILDLRGNSGGNFVAGLRALSLFICSKKMIGKIIRPKFSKYPVNSLNDDLDDEKQIDMLNQSSVLKLETFDNYPCLRAQVKVIVDSDTASTAELVALALREEKQVKIFGAGTSGQLLVGIWYNLEEIWHEPIKITIPEAIYLSSREHEIEGKGVSVDKVIYDKLEHYINGEDSWLKQILTMNEGTGD